MDIVVGSGPAGVSVATALLAKGRQVTMLDGGAHLKSSDLERKAQMAALSPQDWSEQQITEWQSPQFSSPQGEVRRYGSGHAQLLASEIFEEEPKWLGLRASHAVGGLSSVWGAAVLPSRQADIASWPITIDDLAPHYEAVSNIMPISGKVDRLETLLPALSMSDRNELKSGIQGRTLMERLEGRADRLENEGVYFGQARQAVGKDCHYCGMCLHGCPWDQIFSAAHHLTSLKMNPNFTYLPRKVVIGFSEEGSDVSLYMKDGEVMKADRLYLAAGVLETAKIVLASTPDDDALLTLRDSQHFFLPFLHQWKAKEDPETTPHHTLTEAFIEIDDPDVSPFLTHSQIYGWNEYYAREMTMKYGSFLPGSKPLFRALSRRLMVAQTFLHSDHCATISLRLNSKSKRLIPTLEENPETASVMKAASRKLSRAMRLAGLHAISFASRLGAPGESYHSGGTLPMSESPEGLQTDGLGRLNGLANVHIVDASVLPSIPATTITLSVMANAHRIGSCS